MDHGSSSPSLRPLDVFAIIVGLVIGAGIFRAPAVVADNVSSELWLIGAWMIGGVVSILGALCYAELASTYPSVGGEYNFLIRAYGRSAGFLFAWARLVVLQTGSIALLAFVLGDYASEILPLGANAAVVYAALAVVLLTHVNLAGLPTAKWTQNLLTLLTLAGVGLVIQAGLFYESAAAAPESGAFGLAMVFVLLTYGGWNEAAYVSSELRNVRRNMVKVLTSALLLIAMVYLLANWAYLRVLGIAGMSRSDAVAADMMRLAMGEQSASVISLLIVIATIASMNVTILTGARANYALARDFRSFSFLNSWSARTNAPVKALLLQGAIALLLVGLGSLGRSGFETMVQFVSPVFWLFFLLTTISLFTLRRKDPGRRAFTVPGYPVTPLLFAATCCYMFYSSLAYSGLGALVGVMVLLSGTPFLFWENRRIAPMK